VIDFITDSSSDVKMPKPKFSFVINNDARLHFISFISSHRRTARMFAALAIDDDDDDSDDDVRDAYRLNQSDDDDVSTSSSSSSTASNNNQREAEPFVDDDDVSSTALWTWSTGRDRRLDDDTPPTRANANKQGSTTKGKLLRGEKKTLKRLHVERTRAERARRDGFDPSEARTRMELVVRTGEKLTIACSTRGSVAMGQGKVIRALARALRATVEETRIGKRRAFVVGRVDGESEVPKEGSEEWLEMEALCAKPMTSEEYLASDARRERLEATTRRFAEERKRGGKQRGRQWKREDDDDDDDDDSTRRALEGSDFQSARHLGDVVVDEGENHVGSSTHNDQSRAPPSDDFGAFEAHTLGVGSRLMAKMGFTPGSGLGVNSQGITQAPEIEERPKRLGLGGG
jgi:hypothetical protein